MSKLKLELPRLLPNIDETDRCTGLLTDHLRKVPGIAHAHIVHQDRPAKLCIHFDPILLPLGQVERLATETGERINERYRHEIISVPGLRPSQLDPALETELGDLLQKVPGVLHANLDRSTGLLAIAYDSHRQNRVAIVDALGQMAALSRSSLDAQEPAAGKESEHIDRHGKAPAFLPAWVGQNQAAAQLGLAGLALLIGWAGELWLGLPHQAALVFFLVSYIASGYDVARHAIPGLLRGHFDTDILMLVAAGGAAVLGEWAEGAFLLFLFGLGHAGEHYAMDRARNAISALGELMPKTAHVKRGARVEEIPVDALQPDDMVVVRPGDRVPVDGVVVAGASAVDQSAVTGESVPVDKRMGDPVFAGTISQTGALEVRVTHLAEDSTLSRVMKLVQEARSQASPTQQFTERFTAWFVPTVLVLDVLVMLAPPLFGWMPLSQSFYRAMLLLVAASPCALAIGTPSAVLAGIAQAARNGVLIKGGAHLENLGRVQAVAFDKTGTLTAGRFKVTDVLPLNGATPEELLGAAAALEQHSSHPLAKAVVDAAHVERLPVPGASDVQNVAGRGVRGVINEAQIIVGSPSFFREVLNDLEDGPTPWAAAVTQMEADGKTTVLVSRDGHILGVLGLADMPRPSAPEALSSLHDLGVSQFVMLTGDNRQAARLVAKQLGITDVHAELLPEEKSRMGQVLQQRYGPVAMVGDGINDAPVLAASTVGIAMGGAGTAVALETADIVLMADDLSKLPFAVGLSRASRRIVQQNVAVALGVIGVLILTSVLGLMPLSGAVVLHEGSTVAVVLNALRLLRYRTRG